jgi:hypothetical protein
VPKAPHLAQRTEFKSLLLKNPNYFGTAPGLGGKATLEIAENTAYEKLQCIGYNPALGQLEATVLINLPTGYLGDLCHAGSTEYIRFFVDDGSGAGWQDVGVTGFNAHDIPNSNDCARRPTKPLSYVATLPYKPSRGYCGRPVLPNVRAILSWESLPTPGDSSFMPIWGNRLERHIQISPRRRPYFGDLVAQLGDKIQLPKSLEYLELVPLDIPGPPPPELAELAELYGAAKGAGTSSKRGATKEALAVEPHRFGFPEIQAVMARGAFDVQQLATTAELWGQVGLDFGSAVSVLQDTSGDTGYEELDCVGLDYNREILAATFTVKRSVGYSGDLCHAGSTEYVAFWADWDNKCEWSYVGTAQVQVHDIAGIPADGLHYAAFVPAPELDRHRRDCSAPKIARIRAVLSWATPPSTVDPEGVPHWGNRRDVHVQLRPGVAEPPSGAAIRNLGGIAVEDIDTATGMTNPGIHFAHFPSLADALGRACPFGGLVVVEGNFQLGSRYRVSVRRPTDPPGVVTYLTTPFDVERTTVGFSHQVAGPGGFFTYLDPATHFDRTLALWYTGGDERWIVQLEVVDAANVSHFSTAHTIQLDNTAPFADIEITSPGGDCADFTQGSTLDGLFVANDANFGSWSLATLPNSSSIPSNAPSVSGLASTSQTPPRNPPPPSVVVPWTGGHPWSLSLGPPMRPCGYVVQVWAWDRTIVNSVPGSNHGTHAETAFCLRKA